MSTLTEGLSTAIIGMLVVFLGLVLLIAVISLMRVFSKDSAKAKKASQPAAVPAVEAVPEETEEAADEGAVVAAIIAAISMMLEKEGGNSSFIVRRVVRRGLKARA